MDEVRRFCDQLKRSYEGHAWHGPGVRESVEGLTAAQAAMRPLASAHTIWEIVLHITAWEEAALRVLEGQEIGEMPDEQNFPPMPAVSEEAWHQALGHLESVHRRLLEDAHDVTAEELTQTVPGKQYSLYFLLHGVVQHNVYHAGQIVLLRKAIS
ncbi:MAG: DinB family protein [Bryobacteraceae bacterium]|nr:DinB family protein [Bryobacteraceae bacterium]